MPKKLLVIDDDPAITDMLELVLPPEGFEVTSANSGPAGIEGSKSPATRHHCAGFDDARYRWLASLPDDPVI